MERIGCELLQRKNQKYTLPTLFERGGKEEQRLLQNPRNKKDTLSAKGSRGILTKQRRFNIQVF